MKTKTLSANNLKAALWETLNELRSGKIDVREATAIANQSREITRVINTELKIAIMSKEDPSDDLKEFTNDLKEKKK